MTTKSNSEQTCQPRVIVQISSPLPLESIRRMIECLPDTVVTCARVLADDASRR